MNESLIAPAISLVAVAIPLGASYFSGNPRLRSIRDQAKTLDALPEDHPGRAILSEEIVREAVRYKGQRKLLWHVATLRYALLWGLVGLGLIVATSALRSGGTPSPEVSDKLLDSMSTVSYVTMGMAVGLVLLVVYESIVDAVRALPAKKRDIKKAAVESGPDRG